MAYPAARAGDQVLHDAPHCHAPIHPSAPVPKAAAHAPQPLATFGGSINVNIGGSPALRVGDKTAVCAPATCIPSSPGSILRGSASVNVNGQPLARIGDTVSFPGCAGPIPCPTGKVIGPGCPTVMIGG